jgi:hypothetical protein
MPRFCVALSKMKNVDNWMKYVCFATTSNHKTCLLNWKCDRFQDLTYSSKPCVCHGCCKIFSIVTLRRKWSFRHSFISIQLSRWIVRAVQHKHLASCFRNTAVSARCPCCVAQRLAVLRSAPDSGKQLLHGVSAFADILCVGAEPLLFVCTCISATQGAEVSRCVKILSNTCMCIASAFRLETFRRVRKKWKAAICFVMSVGLSALQSIRLSVHPSIHSHCKDFRETGCLRFFENLLRKFKFD